MCTTIKIILIIASIVSVLSCAGAPDDKYVISDFESEEDLDRVQWQCHTLFSISDENISHGNHALRLEFYHSPYPGIAFELPMRNWSRHRTLSLDIYNPQEEVISLSMRIDDTSENSDFKDRYNNSFSIKPGMNHLRIPLASMTTSGTKRSIRLKHIHRFQLFMVQPHKTHVMYIDYVHLT